MILSKSHIWITNCTNNSFLQILLPAYIINNDSFDWIKKEAIDCEITAKRIFSRITESNSYRMTSINVLSVRTISRNLDISRCFRTNDCDDPKCRANSNCVPVTKDFSDTIRRSRCCDVIVRRHSIQQLISDTSPGPQ